MTSLLVTNLNDSGIGSLRAALLAANADHTGLPISIQFTVAGAISLASDLPTITNTVQLNATTIPGQSSTTPAIELNFNGHNGLVFAASASGSSLAGFALGNASGNGVTLFASSVTLNTNYIGLHINGTVFANTGDGVYITALSSNNQIGFNPSSASGVTANVISGNLGNGISLHGSSGNILVDNHIGTSVDGNSAIANGQNGIWLTAGANNNTIGGTAFVNTSTGQVNNPTGDKGTITATFVVPPLGNLVSGNTANGVLIDANSQNNVLNGNFIGTSANGNAAVGNGGDGVHLVNADNNSLIGCQFVNNPFVYYNVLSGNGGNGLHITNSNNALVQANFFGIGANNATTVANALNGILVDGSSQTTQVGGVIPLGNVSAGNGLNGIYVTGTASGFTTFNTFGGLLAFQGSAPNGNDGILIDSTGGNNLIRTNVFSGNTNNGIEIAGNASGVTVDPNVAGLNTVGNSKTVNTGIGIPSMANGNDGLLITGTAHNNIIGGYLNSVIPQNIFSGNLGYGIAITGGAYSNQVFNSVVGLSSTITTALGNSSGGILISSSGANNLIGGTSTDPSTPQANYIGGNTGNGITLAAGVTGDQILNNLIGIDRFGLPVVPNSAQPIAINGSYANNIASNTPVPLPTFVGLPEQEVMAQIEALYVGYFGRAGDATGVNYWMASCLNQMASGVSMYQALNQVSASFATSIENGKYAALANQPLSITNPAQVALATSFIGQVYQNAFNRPADANGLQFWLGALFSGKVSYTSLVYVMDYSATNSDQAILNFKLNAGAYFTAVTQGTTVSSAALVGAVNNVVDQTTYLASEASSNATVAGSTPHAVTYATAFQGNFITGVRGDLNGNVVLSGNQTLANGATQAMLYSGPIQDTDLGYIYSLTPQISGQSVTTSTFYGPDTSLFDPALGAGNVRAVGSYQYSGSTVLNHGMMYQGPVSGGGTWTQLDVPSSVVGGAIVLDTIAHSTMGNLVVGNYDLQGVPASGNGFIYNIATNTWTIMNQAFGGTNQLTTAYGVWQNGVGSTSYTIAGGSNHGVGINQAYLVNYDSSTGVFSHLTYYTNNNQPGLVTHFDGITAVPGGFNLISVAANGTSFATVAVNADGSFGAAQWTPISVPGSAITTGNSVYQNVTMGIYTSTQASGVASYTGVVDQSQVDVLGGLNMSVGAASFSYGSTVQSSTGSLIVGSQSVGNLLGGSIGNDTFVGSASLVKADTIYTDGGADTILFVANRVDSSRVELFAGNGTNNVLPTAPGSSQTAVIGSVVDTSDIPQLGWWGQATGQFGGAVSNTSTNLGIGAGTSGDMSSVQNFNVGVGAALGDSIDVSLKAFSGFLQNATNNAGASLGSAVLSNVLSLGGTVTVGGADVLVMSGNQTFANAAALATALKQNATAIHFSAAQTNLVNHYLIAYQDSLGNTRIADLDIHSATPFTSTSAGQTLAISDMVQLTGVSVATLHSSNIQFVS